MNLVQLIGQITGLGAIVLLGFGISWLYQRKNSLKVPYLVTISPQSDIDLKDNPELRKAGRWDRIGEGHYRVTTNLGEEQLKSLILKAEPRLLESSLSLLNSLTGYGASF